MPQEVSKKLLRSEPDDQLRATGASGKLRILTVTGTDATKETAVPQPVGSPDPVAEDYSRELDSIYGDGSSIEWNEVGAVDDPVLERPRRNAPTLLHLSRLDDLSSNLLRLAVMVTPRKNSDYAHEAVALFDSGASADFVNAKIVVNCSRFIVTGFKEPMSVGVANGYADCKSKAYLHLDLGGLRHSGWFYVLEDLHEDIILGVDTLIRFQDRFDWEKRRFQIASGEYVPFGSPVASPGLLVLQTFWGQERDESPFVMVKESESDFQMDLIDLRQLQLRNREQHSKMILTIPDEPLRKLLLDFRDVFTEELAAGMLPHTRGSRDCSFEVTLRDTKALKPQFPLRDGAEKEIRQQVEALWKAGIIEPSTSVRFAAPLMFVPKKDGTLRMVIDYREANRIIANHQTNVPLMDALVAKAVGKKFFTAVDLTSAFHQQKVEEDSRDITTFVALGRRWRFTLLPFGLKVSPAIMQTTVAELVEGIPGAFNYMDDILLVADSVVEQYQQLKQLLLRFREQRFYLKASKCEVLREYVTFLGYKVLRDGMDVPDSRKETFLNLAVPHTRKMMQLALGFFNFFRNHVQNFAKLARPLQLFASSKAKMLLKERKAIKLPFEKLRQAMLQSAQLKPVLANRPFIVETDASAYAVGAVLFQDLGNGVKHGPIAMFLKSLDVHQEFYPVRQKELLAIVYAMERWERLVRGQRVTVYSDHQSLEYFLRTAKRPEAMRVASWIDTLQNYNVVIQYRSGESNDLADLLSRQLMPVKQMISDSDRDKRLKLCVVDISSEQPRSGDDASVDVDSSGTADPSAAGADGLTVFKFFDEGAREIRAAYAEDTRMAALLRKFSNTPEDKQSTEAFKSSVRYMTLVNGLLVKGGRVVIPAQLAKKWLLKIHNRAHRGITALWYEFQGQFIVRGLFNLILDVVRNCDTCQRRKVSRLPWQPLQPLPIPQRPFEVIHIDEVTALPLTQDGFYGIFTVVDAFSKFAILIAVKRGLRDIEVATLLVDHVFSVFGHPKVMVSDKAKSFLAKTVEHLRNYFGTDLCTTSTNHPQTNGLVERTQRTIVEMLRCMAGSLKVFWPSLLKLAQAEYNRTWVRSLKMLPYKALFGVDPPPIVEVMPDLLQGTMEDYLRAANIVRQAVRDELQWAQDEMAADYNRKHKVVERKFKVGQYVLVNKEAWYSTHQKHWKLYDCYFGPFRVVRIPHPDNPTVVELDLDPRIIADQDSPLFDQQARTINTMYLKPYWYDKDLYQNYLTSPPLNEDAFLLRWKSINGVAFIDIQDEAVGVQFVGAQPGHTARIPFAWFRKVPIEHGWNMINHFLGQVGSSHHKAPTVMKKIFGDRSNYGEQNQEKVNRVREFEFTYPNGVPPPRDPIPVRTVGSEPVVQRPAEVPRLRDGQSNTVPSGASRKLRPQQLPEANPLVVPQRFRKANKRGLSTLGT